MAKSEGINGKKAKEFTDLQESFSRVQSKVHAKDSEIDILMNKINYLESQYFPSNVEYQT